jgi:hypothetical protein
LFLLLRLTGPTFNADGGNKVQDLCQSAIVLTEKLLAVKFMFSYEVSTSMPLKVQDSNSQIHGRTPLFDLHFIDFIQRTEIGDPSFFKLTVSARSQKEVHVFIFVEVHGF